ncbi:MAG: PA2779 family protein [Pseudohongiella sp.]|nr:PA2779 family protein [Pseudohongiella sp.]MDO9520326.1 PA2779 family protein [Pseudohongiella sp.]MDP2126398.1 PA2779 family protein [Pseudohongiella sp.]
MKISKLLKTPGILSIVVAMSAVGVQAPAMADMVGTPALAMQAELQTQRNDVRMFMARDDVRHAMLGYGVSAADVDARINSMTQSELLELQSRMDMLPAGSSAVGLVLGVILIFVLLDLLGATDIFPGI